MKRFLGLLLLVVVCGCAKVPQGAGVANTRRVTFSFTMQNPANPAFAYFIAIRPSNSVNPTDQGPVPVVAPPWGNGIVAGNVNYLISFDLSQPPQQQCVIYFFVDQNLINKQAIAVPINNTVSTDGRTLSCEVDLGQLTPPGSNAVATAQAYQSMQVNFLTQDVIPQGNTGGKIFDSLGDNRSGQELNTWLTIPLNTTGTYNNNSGIEVNGDCSDPALDLIDFNIQVSAP